MNEKLVALYEKGFGTKELTEKEVSELNLNIISTLKEFSEYLHTGIMPPFLASMIDEEPDRLAYYLAAGLAMSEDEEEIKLSDEIIEHSLAGNFDRQYLYKLENEMEKL
jgi:hypothetical protein